jgi:hypothetical protein
MANTNNSIRIESWVNCQGIDIERLQPLVFLAQSMGDPFGYTFDVHHLRVFSHKLTEDFEILGKQQLDTSCLPPANASYLAKQVQDMPVEQVEIAAAYVYFQQKGYSSNEIERSLNADEDMMHGAKHILAELKKLGTKTLVASGAN